MSPEKRDEILQRIVQQDATVLERLDKKPLLIQEYVEKLDRFTELWKEEMISDGEFVGAVKQLTSRVIVIDGNYIQP